MTKLQIRPKHLDLILRIAETGQLQLAAQASAMTQPAASRVLAEVEANLGSALFHRRPTGMEPTPAGQAFLRHARVVQSEMAAIEDEVARLRSGAIGQVRVGTVTGPAIGCLMPALARVRAEAPELRVTVEVGPSTLLFRALEEARVDFILGRIPPGHDTRGLRLHPGRSELVSLLVHASHPLAGQAEVSLAEMAAYPWVIQEEGSPIREAVAQAFHTAQVPVPRRVLNSSSLLVALAQVAEGQAISPQTQEVEGLLTSPSIGAHLTRLDTRAQITVAPYFVIRDARRQPTEAAERVLQEVMTFL